MAMASVEMANTERYFLLSTRMTQGARQEAAAQVSVYEPQGESILSELWISRRDITGISFSFSNPNGLGLRFYT